MIATGGCCFLLRPPALGSWWLPLLLRPAALDGCLLLPLLRLSACGGLQLLLLLRPAALSSLLLIRSPALHPRLQLLGQLLFLTLWLLMLLLLIAACTALGSLRLLLLLRPAALDGCLLLPLLRLSACGGLQLLLLLRPAALSSLLLIRSPALHPRPQLLSQSLFLTLWLLMLLLLIAACWSLTDRRDALARDGRRWRRFAAAINTRTGRAIARGRLAGYDLSPPVLVGGDIYFTVIVFVGLHELEDLWFGRRQRQMSAGLGHVDLAWKQHHEATRMADAIGDAAGVIARPPIEIGARRSDDRRSRILRNHEAAKA